MAGTDMVANKLFSNFLSLAFDSVLADNTTYDLGKISYQTAIGDIRDITNICFS